MMASSKFDIGTLRRKRFVAQVSPELVVGDLLEGWTTEHRVVSARISVLANGYTIGDSITGASSASAGITWASAV